MSNGRLTQPYGRARENAINHIEDGHWDDSLHSNSVNPCFSSNVTDNASDSAYNAEGLDD